MAGWDLFILMAFVAWSVTLGLRARRRASRSLDEYYLAGREVRGFRAGISMAATQFAADTPLLFSGLIAVAGVFALWRLWVYGLAFLLMGFLFAAFWRRARILTDAELVEVRYSGRWRLPLRLAKAVYFGLVINSAVLGFVLLAMFQISEIFFPWHAWLPEGPYGAIAAAVASLGVDLSTGAAPYAAQLATTNNLISIVLLLLFVGLYSTTGGLRGVIASDLLQFGLAMGGSIAFAVLLLWEVAEPGALVDRVVVLYGADTAGRMLSFTPTIEGALMPFLVIMGLQWLFQMNSDGTGYLAQRCMACASDRDAQIAATVFAWVQILGRSLVWLVIGVGLLVLYPFTPAETAEPAFAASRERTFLAGISDHLPVGVRGLMVTALVAALASTIDTHLNWGSSYLTNDVYKRFVCQSWLRREAARAELVFVARATSVARTARGLSGRRESRFHPAGLAHLAAVRCRDRRGADPALALGTDQHPVGVRRHGHRHRRRADPPLDIPGGRDGMAAPRDDGAGLHHRHGSRGAGHEANRRRRPAGVLPECPTSRILGSHRMLSRR